SASDQWNHRRRLKRMSMRSNVTLARSLFSMTRGMASPIESRAVCFTYAPPGRLPRITKGYSSLNQRQTLGVATARKTSRVITGPTNQGPLHHDADDATNTINKATSYPLEADGHLGRLSRDRVKPDGLSVTITLTTTYGA